MLSRKCFRTELFGSMSKSQVLIIYLPKRFVKCCLLRRLANNYCFVRKADRSISHIEISLLRFISKGITWSDSYRVPKSSWRAEIFDLICDMSNTRYVTYQNNKYPNYNTTGNIMRKPLTHRYQLIIYLDWYWLSTHVNYWHNYFSAGNCLLCSTNTCISLNVRNR